MIGEESLAEPQAPTQTAPVHVRRKWIPITAAAWVVGGAIGSAFGSVLFVLLSYAGMSAVLGDLANAFAEALAFGLAGAAAALGQWLVFRRTLWHARGWLLASALGWMVAGVLASLAYELFLYLTRSGSLRFCAAIGMIGSIVSAAMMVGALQWLALRRGFGKPDRWISASTVAWSLGIALTLLGSVTVSLSEGCFVGMVVFPIAGGLVAGAITGEAFARLAGRPASAHVAAGDRNRRPVLVLAMVWVGLLVAGLWSIWSLRAP
jgi:hypothetical protein